MDQAELMEIHRLLVLTSVRMAVAEDSSMVIMDKVAGGVERPERGWTVLLEQAEAVVLPAEQQEIRMLQRSGVLVEELHGTVRGRMVFGEEEVEHRHQMED